MSDKLDFSLPARKTKLSPIFIILIILLITSLIIGLLNLVFLFTAPAGSSRLSNASKLSEEKQKQLAQMLQKRNLHPAAASAWKEYLQSASIDEKERAGIWYAIGKIYQEAGDYENALISYYTSEAVYKREDLEQEIGRRVQECLEYLGKFAALRGELADRVDIDKDTPKDKVVAEIGTEKITQADLDAKIEQQINLIISQYASFMDPEALNKQKEELFKQYSGDDGKIRMLNQYIMEEILYRKAREEQIAEEPEVRALLKQTEKQLLAQSILSKKVGSKINITESDLATFYEANKGKYIEEGKQKGFDEVRSNVYMDLRSQKEKEIQEAFIEELRQLYNVVIHLSVLKGANTAKDEG